MNELLDAVKLYEPEMINFLQEIVAIPSVCGNEQAVIERIKKEMEKIGYQDVRIDGLGNLLGRIGNGSRILAIDGHCDTVDVGNMKNWDMDPYHAKIQDGYLFGRGACDQKGGLACAIYAGKVLVKIGVPEDVTLWMVVSIIEENMEGLCWKYIVEEENLKPDAVLLTEPTNLQIHRGQRGRLEMKVKTSGISCHGSAPDRGVNAIYKMAPIIQDIEKLNSAFADDPFLGKGSITISDVCSTAPSLCAVADSCTIHLDRRLTVGETIETSLEEIRSLDSFKKTAAEIWIPEYRTPSYKGLLYPMQSYCPTWVIPENHEMVKKASQSFKTLFGVKPMVDKWLFSTNGVATMGLFDIPSIGFGPGDEHYAHSPNERIPIDQLAKALAFYVEFVKNF